MDSVNGELRLEKPDTRSNVMGSIYRRNKEENSRLRDQNETEPAVLLKQITTLNRRS